ncbi:MAG: tagaturonate reductase [Pleomorphochaeta sp.]
MKTINEVTNTVKRKESILQFGEGNFLRAFVDWQIDNANEKTDFNSNVVIVQPLAKGLSDMINDQEGLYTTITRGIRNDEIVEDYRKITSVSRCINVYDEFDKYMEMSKSEDLRFVISNTTEAGISYSENCSLSDQPAASFPAKVTQLLYSRFNHFNKEGHGLIFIPCELIEKNGDNLKAIIIRYANEWKLGDDFISWVNSECIFANSLVDRIVTGYPRNEADAICEKIGYKDNLLDTAELFHLWVIEAKKENLEQLRKEFPLDKAGLNVIFTDDMSFYRTRKVRILNGTHTLMVLAAHLYGITTVDEALNDEVVFKFIKEGLFDEIIESMDGDKDMLLDYAKDVLNRFRNPFLNHQVLAISLNSTSKFKTRDLPSLLSYVEKFNKAPQALSFSIASLIRFYKGQNIENRSMKGLYNGKEYLIKDDESVLSFFEDLYKAYDESKTEDRKVIVNKVLSQTSWWGLDLTTLQDLEASVLKYYDEICTKEMKQALTDFVNRNN